MMRSENNEASTIGTKEHETFSNLQGEKSRKDTFLNMYTHDIFVDGAGGSKVVLLTSWKNNSLSKNINLFPKKLTKGTCSCIRDLCLDKVPRV